MPKKIYKKRLSWFLLEISDDEIQKGHDDGEKQGTPPAGHFKTRDDGVGEHHHGGIDD